MRQCLKVILRDPLRPCQRLGYYEHGRRDITNGIGKNGTNGFRKNGHVEKTSTLVLLRHGQSIWNKIPTFTGWCDVPLTPEGELEAKEAGKLLRRRDYQFDIAYTSQLQRARQTCYMALEGLGGSVPVVEAWQLNERHYGALQGRAKDDPALYAEFGDDQLTSWRRDFDSTPPPMDTSHPYFMEPPAPVTESLADCQQRVKKYWRESIVPEMSAGSRVLFVAHANTIRALVSFLDDTKPENIPHIHIPNSVPCVYKIDPDTGDPLESDSKYEGASKGHWLLSTDNQQRLMNKLGGNSASFARSVFDAWDTNGDGVLSKEELIIGMSQWKRDKDIALAALAGKLWEELNNDGGAEPVSIDKFQSYAIMSSQKHGLPFFIAENA